jgi:hypothetical protein
MKVDPDDFTLPSLRFDQQFSKGTSQVCKAQQMKKTTLNISSFAISTPLRPFGSSSHMSISLA